MKVELTALLIGAGAAATGAALLVAPVGEHEPGRASPTIEHSPHPPGDAMSERLSSLFDLSQLPDAPTLYDDPLDAAPAPLTEYRYLGGATSDSRGQALFEKEGLIYSLAPGGVLDGFVLVNFDAKAARFERDGETAALPLQP